MQRGRTSQGRFLAVFRRFATRLSFASALGQVTMKSALKFAENLPLVFTVLKAFNERQK